MYVYIYGYVFLHVVEEFFLFSFSCSYFHN